MLIKELVKLDAQGKFISAVQLSDYDKPLDNLALVKSYIFANNAPDSQAGQSRSVGSVDLLREVRLSYINSSPTNRFVIVANYGHGKSHLALVLANYFAKPYKSPEVQEILGRIGHTLSHNKPEAENFHDFKRQYDRFLVIRLRGDTPRTLHEQFFPALKAALQEHPDTQNAELPFWNQQAKKWLQTKANDSETRQFLKDQLDTDFPNLLQDVDDNKPEAYAQYVNLFMHFNGGVGPNTEGNYSLREAVLWAIDTFCKNAKPLAGVVVLFDEFSQFVERYSQSKAVGELQQLLEGIGERRGQAMFMAFAQHDPDEVAERVQDGQALQNIKRELGRIDRKYALYSLMESVLNAYLAQSETGWEKFLQENPRIKGGLYGQTTELAWETYLKRYDKELHWTNEKFRDIVTKGCFPLHPLTTALLCHLKMAQGMDDDARTILRFVRNRFEFKQNEPVMVEGKINWILPIDLPDYFGTRIAKQQDYDAYENAIQNLEQVMGAEATQAHYDVLKAILLQLADGIHVTGEKQVELLSQMAGLDERGTMQILKQLSKTNITKFDENTKYNSFWPIASNPKALEQKIREQINEKKFGEDELYELNQLRGTLLNGADHIEVNIAWGTPLDWAASTAIVTKEKFTASNLQTLLKPYALNFQGLLEGNRGLVVWLLALDDEDLLYYQQNAQQVLLEAFPGETPPPVLVVLPTHTHKNVADQFLRFQALEQISKDKDAIKEIGLAAFDAEKERTKKILYKALGGLLGDEQQFASVPRKHQTLIIPQRYKANLLTLPTVSLQSVVQRLYELAYTNRPPEFFTDLNGNPKKGASPLRDSVKTVSKSLLFNRIPSTLAGMSSVAQERVCRQNLIAKWHLLSTTYYIQEPDVLSLKRAWDYLESQIKPDEQETFVDIFVPQLFNAPFGFDYNTATLLLCAWIGKHNKELSFYINSKTASLNQIEKLIDQGTPQEFISKMCRSERLSIKRSDSDKALSAGRKLVESIQKGVSRSQVDAEDTINIINNLVTQELCPDDEKEIFSRAVADLTSGLEAARLYDKNAKKIVTSISSETNVRKLLSLHDDVKRLGEVVLVLPTQPANTEIQTKVRQQLKKAVDTACGQAENLSRIEGADAAKHTLIECKELLQGAGFLDLIELVSNAEAKLAIRIKEIKATEGEKALINQINSMTSSADLAKLYEYQKSLQEMSDGSVKVSEQRNRKLTTIQNEISSLEVFATTVMDLATQVSREQVNSQLDSIQGKANRYATTKQETSLAQAKQYLYLFREFITELQPIESRARFLRTPEEVQEVLATLEKLDKKYAEELVQNHKALIENLRIEIETREKAEYLKTQQRVNSLSQEIEAPTTKFSELKNKLSQISGFISPEVSAQIELLREKFAEKEAEYQRLQNERTEKERQLRLQKQEQERIALLQKQEEERVARLQKQEEESRLKLIDAKKVNADLETLYAYVEDLQALTDSTPAVAKARSQRLSEIKIKTSELETFASNVKKVFEGATRDQLDALLNQIKSKYWSYVGSEYESVLSQAQKYLEKLNSFYRELKETEKLSLQTLDDFNNIQAGIEQIATKYSGQIAKNHRADIEKAQQDAEYRAQVACSRTEDAFSAIEAAFETGKISDLKNKLDRLTGYITPELNSRIDAFRVRLDEKEKEIKLALIEKETQDVMARIEELYLSIPDAKKRQECLEHLQQLP